MKNTAKKGWNKARCRMLMHMLIDAILMNIGMLGAVLMDFSQPGFTRTLFALGITAPIMAVVTAGMFYCFRVYRIIWKFAGIRDVYKILAAIFVAESVYFGSHAFLVKLMGSRFTSFSLHTYASGTMFAVGLVAVYRLLIRQADRSKTAQPASEKKQSEKLLIVGGGAAGALVIKDLSNSPALYSIVGIVDDDPEKAGRSIYGVQVLGNRNDIQEICRKFSVNSVLFCIPACPPAERVAILNICSKTGCTVKVLPGVVQLMDGKIDGSLIRKIEIEDLLERDPIRVDNGLITDYVHGKTVLVTGGGGSIGSELCRQLAKSAPEKLVIFDIYENNAYAIEQELRRKYPQLELVVLIGSVRDEKRLERVFDRFRPAVVFHAAAHKHVPLMEVSPIEAIKNNVFGTLNTVKAADKFGVARFVLISTDKAVNPTNVMGATKRLCEMIVQTYAKRSKTQFAAVRFGNVLGSNGSVVPLFKEQIACGGPVTVTHPDIIRYFMTIPEAVSLVLQAGALAKGGEIFVLDMGKPVRILDMAEKLIRLSGYEPYTDIKIEFSGLRPGEKLYEELLMDEEGLSGTENKLIHIGKPIDLDPDFLEQLEELRKSLSLENAEDLNARKIIKKLVPTYHPPLN